MSKFLAALTLFTTAAMADTPNRTTMSFPDFVEASGCVIIDKGGYQNLASANGGNCPFAVTQAYLGGNSRTITVAGSDGLFGTADDRTVQVSDN